MAWKAWFNILSNGFTHSSANKYIYSKFTNSYGMIIYLYVDDLQIFGTNLDGIFETKKYLTSKFKMKYLNDTDIILGIKVKKHGRCFALNQFHYIDHWKVISLWMSQENY